MMHDAYTVLTTKRLNVASFPVIRRQDCLANLYTCKIQGNWKYNIVTFFSCMVPQLNREEMAIPQLHSHGYRGPYSKYIQ